MKKYVFFIAVIAVITLVSSEMFAQGYGRGNGQGQGFGRGQGAQSQPETKGKVQQQRPANNQSGMSDEVFLRELRIRLQNPQFRQKLIQALGNNVTRNNGVRQNQRFNAQGRQGMNRGNNRFNQGQRGMNQGRRNGMGQGQGRFNQGRQGMNRGNNRFNQGQREMNQGRRNGMGQGQGRFMQGQGCPMQNQRGMRQGQGRFNQGRQDMNRGNNRFNQGQRGMNQGRRNGMGQGQGRFMQGQGCPMQNQRGMRQGQGRFMQGQCCPLQMQRGMNQGFRGGMGKDQNCPFPGQMKLMQGCKVVPQGKQQMQRFEYKVIPGTQGRRFEMKVVPGQADKTQTKRYEMKVVPGTNNQTKRFEMKVAPKGTTQMKEMRMLKLSPEQMKQFQGMIERLKNLTPEQRQEALKKLMDNPRFKEMFKNLEGMKIAPNKGYQLYPDKKIEPKKDAPKNEMKLQPMRSPKYSEAEMGKLKEYQEKFAKFYEELKKLEPEKRQEATKKLMENAEYKKLAEEYRKYLGELNKKYAPKGAQPQVTRRFEMPKLSEADQKKMNEFQEKIKKFTAGMMEMKPEERREAYQKLMENKDYQKLMEEYKEFMKKIYSNATPKNAPQTQEKPKVKVETKVERTETKPSKDEPTEEKK